ncbi:MAG: hypothetical protein ACR2OG_15285 [Gemmatimonadaceae bacterium]
MIEAVIWGVVLGISGARPLTAVGAAFGFAGLKAAFDVFVRWSPLLGRETDYVRFVQLERAKGNTDSRLRVRFLMMTMLLLPAIALAAYFFIRWLFDR